MPQSSVKRRLRVRPKPPHHVAADTPQPEPVRLPAPWATALARVKRHIQTESRQRAPR